MPTRIVGFIVPAALWARPWLTALWARPWPAALWARPWLAALWARADTGRLWKNAAVPDVSEPIVVAAFDFDGTLTRGGSVWPFLAAVAGRRALWWAALRLAPLLAAGAVVGGSRADRAKEQLFVAVLEGRAAADVEQAAASFGRHHFQRRARADVVRRFEAHRRAGHHLAIVSASPELYLRPVAEVLGADTLMATRLAVSSDGRLTGRFEGPNCRGPQKRQRLQRWATRLAGHEPTSTRATARQSADERSRTELTTSTAVGGGKPAFGLDAPEASNLGAAAGRAESSQVSVVVWAYGNSAGDLDMLLGADVPVAVGRLGRVSRLRRFPSLRHAPDPLHDSPMRHRQPPTGSHC